jgi:glutathione S-transferase
MILYDFGLAINARKLRIYLAEKGLADRGVPIARVEVNTLTGGTRTPEFLKKNPMGRLPVLELDDGTCLSESLAIVEYLEELFPSPPLIGETPLDRARTRALERISELDVLLPVYTVFKHDNPKYGGARPPSKDDADAARAKAGRALDAIEGVIGAFVTGDRVSIADATLFTAVSLAEHGKIGLLAGRPRVERWYREFAKRTSAKA